jgi:hypothetical protein
MKNLLFILGILVIFFGFSCKTTKVVTIEKPKSADLEKLYQELIIARPEYKNLEIRFNFQFEGAKQSMALKGTCKIYKDSLIWASLSPGLGIEAVRFICNKDSLFIMDRINRTLTKGDYSYMKKVWKVDVDYYSLQAMLTGEFFIYPKVKDMQKEFVNTFTVRDSSGLAVYRKTAGNQENFLRIDKSTNKVFEYFLNDLIELRNMQVRYTFQSMQEGFQFPKLLHIKTLNSGNYTSVDLEYTKILLNNNPGVPFTVPTNYSVINH